MTSPHFLSEKEWNQHIEQNTFKVVPRITEDLLRSLNELGSVFVQTSRRNEKIPYDRHQWSHSQKGSIPRHQPAYKKMVIQGCPTHAIRCTDINNSTFKKDIVHLEKATYYHYFITKDGVYWEPGEEEVKKPRITDDTAGQIRDLLKTEGTAKDAYEQAKNQGLPVSRRQCHNQLRNIRESPGSEPREKIPRRKREFSLDQLETLKQMFPNDVTLFTDANSQVRYQIKIFATGKIDVPAEEYIDPYVGYNGQFNEDQVQVKDEPDDTYAGEYSESSGEYTNDSTGVYTDESNGGYIDESNGGYITNNVQYSNELLLYPKYEYDPL